MCKIKGFYFKSDGTYKYETQYLQTRNVNLLVPELFF